MLLSAGHHPERISERRQPQKCFPARIHLPAGHPADPNERGGTDQPGKEPRAILIRSGLIVLLEHRGGDLEAAQDFLLKSSFNISGAIDLEETSNYPLCFSCTWLQLINMFCLRMVLRNCHFY